MSLPRMSLHIGDYLKDTAHLDAPLHGAYLLLIMHYWANGRLPDDDRQLCQIARMTPAAWRRTRPVVQAFFHDGWKHKRIDKEMADAQEKYERRASAGRKGGRPQKQCESNAFPLPKQPITLTDNQKKDGGDGGDARASPPPKIEPLVTPEAHAIADEIAVIAGYVPQHPPVSWCGAAMHVSKWLREGWTREVIIVGAKQAMARKRDGPPHSIRFFEHEIAREIARQAQPLPRVKVPEGQEVTIGGHNGQHRNGSNGNGSANGGPRDFADYAVQLAREIASERASGS